jgi:hypothetical protein
MDDQKAKTECALVTYNYAVMQYARLKEAGLNPELLIEQKVYPELFTGSDQCWGSADVIIKSDTCIEVIDHKTGFIPVSSNTGQLKIYALGALAHYTNQGQVDGIKWIRTTISQPRTEGDAISSDIMTKDELMHWCETELKPAIIEAEREDSPFNPGNSQCQFCRIKATCPALAEEAQKLAMSTFKDQTGKSLDDLANVDPATLTAEQISDVLSAAPMIKGWIKAIEDYALEELRNYRRIPGFKAVRSGKRNQWSGDDMTVLRELTEAGIDYSKLIKETIISAPQALKLKGLPKEQREAIESHVVKSEGSLKVVPVSNDAPDEFPEVKFKDVSFLD